LSSSGRETWDEVTNSIARRSIAQHLNPTKVSRP